MQAAQLGSSGSIEVDGSYSGLSEGLHMPGRLADWSQVREVPHCCPWKVTTWRLHRVPVRRRRLLTLDRAQQARGPPSCPGYCRLPASLLVSGPATSAHRAARSRPAARPSRRLPLHPGTLGAAHHPSCRCMGAGQHGLLLCTASHPWSADMLTGAQCRSVRWSSPELVTIDLKIAPLNLESFTGNAAAPSMSASGTQAAGLQEVLLGREAESAAAASLCALARGVCAMLPAACTQFQAQVSSFRACLCFCTHLLFCPHRHPTALAMQVAQTVSKKRAECAAQTACSGAACTLQVEHQPKQQQQVRVQDWHRRGASWCCTSHA